MRGGGGAYTIKTTTGFTQTDNNKIALSWNGDLNIYINGSLASSTSINSLPVGLNELKLSSSSGFENFEGNVKDLRVYNTALTGAELIALTT